MFRVQQAGGRIELETAVGVGTTFRVYLPTSNERVRRLSKSLPAIATGTETILVVDDDPHIRCATSRVLRGNGYRTLEACDGRSALDIIAGHHIDLLIADVVMPGMNGRELAEAALVSDPLLHVLYMSGYTDDEVLARGVARDRVDILEKPFHGQALAAKVRALLDRSMSASKEVVCGS